MPKATASTGHSSRKDWAKQVKKPVDENFPAAEAFEIAQKLEIHYTPKHGSRLNIAEIELSAMTSQCLDRRIDTLEKLQSELAAWQRERNRNQKTVKWQFTAKDARIKLHGLYTSV